MIMIYHPLNGRLSPEKGPFQMQDSLPTTSCYWLVSDSWRESEYTRDLFHSLKFFFLPVPFPGEYDATDPVTW